MMNPVMPLVCSDAPSMFAVLTGSIAALQMATMMA